tara:strand:+ start:196 stop:360 length:165 start_codon:yes stop_codon:yes gene_type:complete
MPYLTIKSTIGAKKIINNFHKTFKQQSKEPKYIFSYGVYFKEENNTNKVNDMKI